MFKIWEACVFLKKNNFFFLKIDNSNVPTPKFLPIPILSVYILPIPLKILEINRVPIPILEF